MAKIWKIEFDVRPYGLQTNFPVDMLRYDRCMPKSETDAGNIMETFYRRRGEISKDMVIGIVKYSHGDKKWTPQFDRWKSFGWEVMPDSLDVGEWS